MGQRKKKKPKAGFLSSIVGRMKSEVDMFKKNKPAFGNAANAASNTRGSDRGRKGY